MTGQHHPACHQCLRAGLHCRTVLFRGGASAWKSANLKDAHTTPAAQDAAPTFNAYLHDGGGTTLPTPEKELQRMTTMLVPSSLNIAAFKDNVQASWLLQHYTHRPALKQVLFASWGHIFGAAAVSAATATSTTLFAKFYNIPLWPHSKPIQSPYCQEYASAVQALSIQVPLFELSRLEEVMVPALLLLISEVCTLTCALHGTTADSF